ncbi:GNAT family N-acetyltransferase [Ornithinibacillus scapharcae]|uniref:GNAT family N-acetyltransferase n=1 Tax=Ornithinibacillus scapharcae TaxID=1147159 RepID=UPI000225B692|nr:GNAT family N-acetyltransferase [Ornithinibacillus scapharcae]
MERLVNEIPVLHTKNYMLRGVSADDAPRLFDFLSDKTTMRFITPKPVETEGEVVALINQYQSRFLEGKEIPWVIVGKETGDIIGQFRLHKMNNWHKKAEMGAVIHESYQHKGVMTEIMPVILSFVFESLQLNRLVGDIFSGNVGSRKLLEKYGFRREGVLRQTDFDGEVYHDTVVYSMLRNEYVSKVFGDL